MTYIILGCLNIPILDIRHNNYPQIIQPEQIEHEESQSIITSPPIEEHSNISISSIIETISSSSSPEISLSTNIFVYVYRLLQTDITFYIYITLVIILQISFTLIFIFLTIFYENRILTYIFGYIGVSARYFLSVYLNKTNRIPYGSLISNIGATIIMSTTDSFVVFIYIIYFINRKLIELVKHS